MDIPPELIVAFPPSADLLLERARLNIDDAMLVDIARADYGYGAEEVLPALRQIRNDGVIPSPMDFQLDEVLSLTRWCNPELPNQAPFEPGPSGLRGHHTRLFVCAVLMRAAATELYLDHSEDSTIARCLESAKFLGDELNEAVACFLTWRLSRSHGAEEPDLFIFLGLLLIAVRLRSKRFADPVLGAIAEWVMAREAIQKHDGLWSPPRAFSLQQGFWWSHVEELQSEAAAIQTESVRTNVQLCALLLETG